MAEAEKFVFSYKEIVTALIKEQGIHSGIWSLYIEFGIMAANVELQAVMGQGVAIAPGKPKGVTPMAMIPIQKIGILQGEELNDISVDAAEVNPKPKKG